MYTDRFYDESNQQDIFIYHKGNHYDLLIPKTEIALYNELKQARLADGEDPFRQDLNYKLEIQLRELLPDLTDRSQMKYINVSLADFINLKNDVTSIQPKFKTEFMKLKNLPQTKADLSKSYVKEVQY